MHTNFNLQQFFEGFNPLSFKHRGNEFWACYWFMRKLLQTHNACGF